MRFDELATEIGKRNFLDLYGRVIGVRRDHISLQLPEARVGSLCHVESAKRQIPLEIIGLDAHGSIAMPLDDFDGIRLGDRVRLVEEQASIPVGKQLLGRVVDSLGKPYDGDKAIAYEETIDLYRPTENPMSRAVIRSPLELGIKSIDGMLTCGRGQRMGIFAGSGVGKSVLLGMMARNTSADVVVIALIGERGREVKEFIEHELGPTGRKKSVIVVETSDKSPVRRVRGAWSAIGIADYFRQQGANVLLMMDSLTRFAMAQREIGLAGGEPPASKGYPPSTFTLLAKLVERAGNWGSAGSITGLYTVLVEGDDLSDPVADSARSILDGHIVLSRRLANRGHYPAVDVLSSVSRVMDLVVDRSHVRAVRRAKELMARFHDNEDAIQFGMYVRGMDPRLDEAVDMEPLITSFLKQDREQSVALKDARTQLVEIVGNGGQE